MPPRNPGFTGREEDLTAIRGGLLASERKLVRVLHGIGGVGKTQLAVEYVHRFADSYDLAWWINADQAGLISSQFAELAEALSCTEPDSGLTEAARLGLLGELRRRDRWLLVFDNAESPDDMARWLPGGATGHVLITSRRRNWAEIAVPAEVDVLPGLESAGLLRQRVAWLSAVDAETVAAAMGSCRSD